MKRVVTALLVVALAFGAIRLVEGQRPGRGGRERRNRVPEASAALASITSLKCAFSAAASAAWEGGEPQVETKKSAADVRLSIDRIDVQDGSAEIGGGFRGGDNVIVKLVGANLHFLDVALNGALGVVTVFARETHDGRLQAVYSRAGYVDNAFGGSGKPEMAQYYGDCEVGR